MPSQSAAENVQPPLGTAGTEPAEGNLYFFDYKQAYQAAMTRRQVPTQHPTITSLQVCFYDGPAREDALDNMVNLPFEEVATKLVDLPYQLPTGIIFPIGTPANFIDEISRVFEKSLIQVKEQRSMLVERIKKELTRRAPEFDHDKPLRILVRASRLTTVMQHCSKQLATAMKNLGHEVLLDIEENDMQLLDEYLHLKNYREFNPHVVFNINALSTEHLHPDVFHFSWWQDPMPCIVSGKALPWRSRDIVLSLTRDFDNYLRNCKCPAVKRQHFCIDEDIFNSEYPVPRENKIVFIGSSYRDRLTHSLAEKGALEEIVRRLEGGDPINESFLRPLAEQWNINYHHLYWDLFHYAARDITLQWLCRESTIPVEVYGRGWEGDPVVQPHYRGELPHGKPVAEMYNSARFALITHPFEINSQRLVEAAACGAQPVIFDCRHTAEAPHWDQYCRFFRTAKQLSECLTDRRNIDPRPVAEQFTYKTLAKYVTETVYQKLNW